MNRHCGPWLTIGCVLLAGCQSPQFSSRPALSIMQRPPARIGGPVEMEEISGRADHARAGQQVVVYARSGTWWIQPFVNQPFTKIQSDSTWKTTTHLGSEYAALLVDAGYRPASKLSVLPEAGEGIAAVTSARGRASELSKNAVLHFGGYEWSVRSALSDHGGEANSYSALNAWTDTNGFLHLRMAERDGVWTCAEVNLAHSLGHGTYRFVVQDSARMSLSAVLGFFTWDDLHSENFHSELDIELSRWGDPAAQNAQYVIQPFYVPDNFVRFNVQEGPALHEFRWQPGSVLFQSTQLPRAGRQGSIVGQHTFHQDVPSSGDETLHIDLYDFHHRPESPKQATEVVIQSFEFKPL